jgi:hypothetical protein
MAASRLRWHAIAHRGKALQSDLHATTLAAALVHRTASVFLAAPGGQSSLVFLLQMGRTLYLPRQTRPGIFATLQKRVLGCTAKLVARQGSELAELDENASTPDAQW